jgi:hypothetical protein
MKRVVIMVGLVSCGWGGTAQAQEQVMGQVPPLPALQVGWKQGVDVPQVMVRASASFAEGLKQATVKATSTSTDSADMESLTFGKDYLRLAVSDLYIPRSRTSVLSVMVNVTTLNKEPLVFKWAYEPKPRQAHSAQGQFLVVPYVAMNSKTPFEVALEKRATKNLSTTFGLIQGLLGAAANMFTGGALTTVSTLTNYSAATNNLVKEYETRTQTTDINRQIIFDVSDSDTIEAPKQMIAFFTNGFPHFRVKDARGTVHLIKESTKGQWVKATAAQEAKYLTPYRFEFLDHQGQKVIAYPLGDIPFAVLAMEKYNPYPDLEKNPDRVLATRSHFRELDKIFLKQGADANEAEKKKLRQEMITSEGIKLHEALCNLTDTGDLSLQHAKVLLTTYCKRAQTFGAQPTGYDPALLNALASNFYP